MKTQLIGLHKYTYAQSRYIRRKFQEEIICDDVIKYYIIKDIYRETELRLPGKLRLGYFLAAECLTLEL